MLTPLLEELSEDPEVSEKIEFASINIDESQDVASELMINSIPTIILFSNEVKPVWKQIGYSGKADIKNALLLALEKANNSNDNSNESSSSKNGSVDSNNSSSSGKKVYVYSAPNCPYCQMAKEYLLENKIDFEDVDVSKNRQGALDMIQKSGQTGVPVIDIDGNIIIGYDLPRIRKYLGMNQ
jgi:glutaredoxin-like YruB-family protein